MYSTIIRVCKGVWMEVIVPLVFMMLPTCRNTVKVHGEKPSHKENSVKTVWP